MRTSRRAMGKILTSQDCGIPQWQQCVILMSKFYLTLLLPFVWVTNPRSFLPLVKMLWILQRYWLWGLSIFYTTPPIPTTLLYGQGETMQSIWRQCCSRGFHRQTCCYVTIYLNHLNAVTVPFRCPQTITGCFPKIKQLVNDNTLVIVGVALGIAVLEVRLWLSSSASAALNILVWVAEFWWQHWRGEKYLGLGYVYIVYVEYMEQDGKI